MDWLSDALSRILAWFNSLLDGIVNFFVAYVVNPLFSVYNDTVDRLLDPQRYFPRFDVITRINEVLSFAVDYVRLVWLLVDSVSYAWIVSVLLTSYLLLLPFALTLRAWFILRRTALVS